MTQDCYLLRLQGSNDFLRFSSLAAAVDRLFFIFYSRTKSELRNTSQ